MDGNTILWLIVIVLIILGVIWLLGALAPVILWVIIIILVVLGILYLLGYNKNRNITV